MKPFDPTAAPEFFVTRDGLRVGLISLPPGSQAAALVRVAGGAHDAPVEYPGLAHFLEHLLFLGSQGYAVDDGLMAFVQGCGGQLNASTRERHTDFFFQVQPAEFAEGLKCLLDMLARPLLAVDAQLREREVLQAEFLARNRDSETLCDAALGTALAEPHPFGGFHAGNRDTLAVESADFQAALTGYHRRFYHGGAAQLLVAAPLQRDDLQALLEAPQCRFPTGQGVHAAPPRLQFQPGWSRHLELAGERPRLLMAYALDDLPAGAGAALDLLGCWLASEAAHGLLARLREGGWCEALALRVPYWHPRQGVLVLDLPLSERGQAERARVVGLVAGWLDFFAGVAGAAPVWDEYRRVRQRGLTGMDPLSRLRYWIEPDAWSPQRDATEVQQALAALLRQMQATGPALLSADPRPGEALASAGFSLRLADEPLPRAAGQQPDWQLPARNPWLQEAAAQHPLVAASLPAVRWLQPEQDDPLQQGALYLRWRFPRVPAFALGAALQAGLRDARWAARQAGVDLAFEDFGSSWSLALVGYAPVLPQIAADLLPRLGQLPPAVLAEGQAQAGRAYELDGQQLLVRQLLGRLPRLLGGEANPAGDCTLGDTWRGAQWDALAIGLADEHRGLLGEALADAPGRPAGANALDVPVAPLVAPHWWTLGGAGSETAVVLFCPLPSRRPRTEAAWRLLARLMEAPFFRRLRSELQLGYAVFCGFRQFGEHAGVVFVVQSPEASAAAIVAHIETFLADFAERLPGLLAEQSVQIAEAAAAHRLPAGQLRRRAEQLWQACLAGVGLDHPQQVAEAMVTLDAAELAAQLQHLRGARRCWQVASNAAAAF